MTDLSNVDIGLLMAPPIKEITDKWTLPDKFVINSGYCSKLKYPLNSFYEFEDGKIRRVRVAGN